MDALPPNLEMLLNPAVAEVRSTVPRMREQMIWEAACSLGARGGLANRTLEIRKALDARAPQLDRFSFQPFMTTEGMLPPVIAEERDPVRQEGDKDKRSASFIYRMVREARLVTIAPTWRDYLFAGLVQDVSVEMPHKSFNPANAAEKEIWRRAVTECWSAGVAQADGVFNENMSRFERDYYGTIRYKMLAGRGMVEGLRVGTEFRAVSGNSTEIIIDDQRYRITGAGGLIPDSRRWK